MKETPWKWNSVEYPTENYTENYTEYPVESRFHGTPWKLVEFFMEFTVEFSMGYSAAKSVENYASVDKGPLALVM